jgi:hypothetical protein
MTGSSTFQIFPETNIVGDTMNEITPEGVTNNICKNQCRCLCESTNGCVAFTVDKANGKNCKLKNNLAVTEPNIKKETYIKGARGNYLIFWIIFFLILLAIFLGGSLNYNINRYTPFYTEKFS